MLVLGECLKGGFDDTTITAKTKYSVNIVKARNKVCLHYDAANKFLCVNGVKIYQSKAKSSEIKPHIFCMGSISNDLAVNNINTGLKGFAYNLFVCYETIDVSDIVDIHKYVVENHDIL